MTPPFQNRSTDAPLIRFLPDDPGVVGPRDREIIRAIRPVPRRELDMLSESALRMDLSMENLLLAAFASLLSRLARQGVISIAIDITEIGRAHV